MSAKIGAVPPDKTNRHQKEDRAQHGHGQISLVQDGSTLSKTVLASLEQLRTLLDLMIDERVAELLEERNRLPRFGEECKLRLRGIDQQLYEYTTRKMDSWKLIEEVIEELMAYERQRRQHTLAPLVEPFAKTSLD